MHAFTALHTITFESLCVGRSFSHIQGIRVHFVYEGHPVEVKVAGAKKVEYSYSCNVKLRLALTLVL